ncbi:MAG: hypothetical protein AAF708_03195 [Deinococcota bacterium]
MLKRTLVMLALVLVGSASLAQYPVTDVFMVMLPEISDDAMSEAVMIAADDIMTIAANDHYDNQPSFTADGSGLLFVSEDEIESTNIYRYDMASGDITQLTDTVASEFSPRMTPDGQHISAVQIEPDGTTQRLWRYELTGENPTPVPEDVYRVGYYHYPNADTVVMIVVADSDDGLPLSLVATDLTTGETETIVPDVGVGVQKLPNYNAVSFVYRLEDGTSTIGIYDTDDGGHAAVADTLEGVDAHTWLPNGPLIAAQDNIIYRWDADAYDWTPFLDFSDTNITGINRLAANPDGTALAFVVSR